MLSDDVADVMAPMAQPEYVVEDYTELYLNPAGADVTIKVDGEDEVIPGHSKIIGPASDYLGQIIAASNGNLVVRDVRLDTFKFVLKHIYYGYSFYSDMDIEQVLNVVSLAKRFQLTLLLEECGDHLRSEIDMDNFVDIYNFAHEHGVTPLVQYCLDYIDFDKAMDLIDSDALALLEPDSLVDFINKALKRVKYPARLIFEAVSSWINIYEASLTPGSRRKVLNTVELDEITTRDMFQVVKPSGLFDSESILKALEKRFRDGNITDALWYSHLNINENVASQAQLTIDDSDRSDCTAIFREKKDQSMPVVASSLLGDNNCIMVTLDDLWLINCIVFCLLDSDIDDRYSYILSVSKDGNDWREIADNSKHWCRSQQLFHVKQLLVKYIKIQGIRSYRGNELDVVEFKCMFKDRIPPLSSALEPINTNVASEQNGAVIINGDRVNGGIRHTIDSDGKSIEFLISRPQNINAINFTIVSPNSQLYSYKLFISKDGVNYQPILYRRRTKGIQPIKFEKEHKASFIRIQGIDPQPPTSQFMITNFQCQLKK